MPWSRRFQFRRNVEEQLDAELRDHLERLQADYVANGMDPSEAARRARLEFGGLAQTKEACRDERRFAFLNGIGQDVRLALRSLRATPVVSAVAILSLALGIGANTAIFSLIDGLALRRLPVHDPARLVLVVDEGPSGTSDQWSSAVWDAIRMRAQRFDGACAWSSRPVNLAASGEVDFVNSLSVSGDFFSTLGVRPLLGRTLKASDDRQDGGADGPVAVISYPFWHARFGGRADILGQPLRIGQTSYTIVGVTPPDFFGPEVGRTFDVALPIGSDGFDSPMNTWLRMMLRLAPGQSIESATALLRSFQPAIREAAMPREMVASGQQAFLARPLTLVPGGTGVSALRSRYQRPLVIMLVVVALVLFIACANLANLLLARTATRRQELSVRVALGAGRWRLARQLLVESTVLGVFGAAAGLLIAAWSSRALVAQLSSSATRTTLNLSLDWRVLAFAVSASVIAAALFGVVPALHATRAQPIEALKSDRRTISGESRLSRGLVVAQVAVSLVLVVAAGLFIRTFWGLVRVPLGFDEDRALVVNVIAARTHVGPSVAARAALFSRLVEAAAAVPGVAHVAGSLITPVSNSSINNEIDVSGARAMPAEERVSFVNYVTPGWLTVLGTPLRTGRDFSTTDTTGAPPVALVNEAFVRKFLPDRDPLGETVTIAPLIATQHAVPKTIVGVVSDAVYRSLREGTRPTLYVPLAQYDKPFPLSMVTLTARSAGASPEHLTRSIGAALTAVDSDLSFSFQMLANQIDAARLQERVVALLSGLFAGLALLLAALGLYGLASYSVTRRRTEIGIRMALGCDASAAVRLVVSRTLLLVVTGIVVGTAASLGLTRLMSTLLYGVTPHDLATLAGATAILLAVGLAAVWVPARRASRVDPALVMREA